MKTLYYCALAHPHVAAALAAQATETLRPFIAYLNAAKAAARVREARSACRWEPVPVERLLRFSPRDTLVEVPVTEVGYRLAGWEGPPPDMPLFVGPHFRPVQPVRKECRDGELRIWLTESIEPQDAVWWASRLCRLEPLQSQWPSRIEARLDGGGTARVLNRVETSKGLRIVVEGTDPFTLVAVDGAPLPHRVLSPSDGATYLQGSGDPIPWNGEIEIWGSTLPDTPILLADNGVRWQWQEDVGSRRRGRGVWIQLMAPENGDDEGTVDPRSAYCDEGVREVRTHRGNDKRHAYRVLGFHRDSYRLELDRLPPEGSTLFLPSNVALLSRQLQAVYRLRDEPLPHHRNLLRLCEDPERVKRLWPDVTFEPVSEWHLLKDDQWDGTSEQQEFVQRALGTEDFAFLEGPPGSGKTHAICELVLQCIDRNMRVLLCSTTHVAVDNVLERLVGRFPQVEAVRIGLTDRVDHAVRSCQIDEKVEALTARWRDLGVMAELDDTRMEAAAESIVLASANLTCGTTTGILAHPYIRSMDGKNGLHWPHFDILILDEASKTTFQEFLVPAQIARKWIIVGDVRQLPPFTDSKDLESSIQDIHDENRVRFPDSHQRACLLRFRLARNGSGLGMVRWLIEEPPEVLVALAREIASHPPDGIAPSDVVRIVESPRFPFDLSLSDLRNGSPTALRLLAAQWILLPDGLGDAARDFLPPDLLPSKRGGKGVDEARAYRFRHWLRAAGRFARPIRDGRTEYHDAAELMDAQQKFLQEETWARQVAWRLGRIHQLARARNEDQRNRYQAKVDDLLPAAPELQWVASAVDAIRDVGVKSVIEALRVPRVNPRVRRRSALSDAIPPEAWDQRSVLLSYQHRMHGDISALPRRMFYQDQALRDANTLKDRETRQEWRFLPEAPSRRFWLHVAGTENRGINREEIQAMERVLGQWMQQDKAPRVDGGPWEIACLSFYHRQELAIRDMLRRLTGQHRAETRFSLPHTTIVCGTVDRFQGREADLVLLSLRNTHRMGYLDSPNRLNVAITRARFLLVVIGHREFYQACPSPELAELARETPVWNP